MSARATQMKAEHLEAVADLWVEYGARSPLNSVLTVDRNTVVRNLSMQLAGGRSVTLVALEGDTVVGFLHGVVDTWIFCKDKFLTEVALYVKEGYSGGAGAVLLRAMQGECRTNGVKLVVAGFYGGVDDQSMEDILTALGYTERGKVMFKEL